MPASRALRHWLFAPWSAFFWRPITPQFAIPPVHHHLQLHPPAQEQVHHSISKTMSPRSTRRSGVDETRFEDLPPPDQFLLVLGDISKVTPSFFWLLHPIPKDTLDYSLAGLLGIDVNQLQSLLSLCGFMKNGKLQFKEFKSKVNAFSMATGKRLELSQCQQELLQRNYLCLGQREIGSPKNVREQNKRVAEQVFVPPRLMDDVPDIVLAECQARLDRLLDSAAAYSSRARPMPVSPVQHPWNSPARVVRQPEKTNGNVTPEALASPPLPAATEPPKKSSRSTELTLATRYCDSDSFVH